MKIYIWITIFCLLSSINTMRSMPAFPKKILIERKGNVNLKLNLQGDENLKYAIEESTGLTVVQDSTDCWRYLILGNSSLPELSDIKVSDATDADLLKLIKNTPKGLIPFNPQSKKSISKVSSLSSSAQNYPVIGERKALIILVEFPDNKFHCQRQDFELLFNMENYSLHGATGSVADYFNEVSEGQLNLISTIIGPYTSQKNMSYYGKNSNVGGGDANPFALFKEALNYAKSIVNLEEFDCNKDGLIDNIHIIYAGYGEEAGASSNAIWAHECTFEPIEVSFSLKIDRYSCSPELRNNKGYIITTIGPPCHEICHALGAMDFYDTDYSDRGEYQGTSNWDIMAHGSWNNEGSTPAWPNPYVRAYNFGWSSPEILNKNGTFDFNSISNKKIYQINTSEENDFFLLEYRNGKYFSSAEPGTGLLIFHIGPNIEKNAKTNSINATFPQQCYPVCASSDYPIPTSNPTSYGDISSAKCPFSDLTGYSEFNKSTIPGAFCISGKSTDFSISEIHEKDGNLIFTFYSSVDDIDTEDPDSQLLWKESFKKSNVLDNWIQENISGHAVWSRQSNLNENDVEHYLSLKAIEGVINPREIKTKLISPEIFLAESQKNEILSSQNPSTHVTFSAKIRNFSKNSASWKFIFINGEKVISEFDTIVNSECNKEQNWIQIKKEISIELDKLESIKLIIETQMESGTDRKIDLSDLQLSFFDSDAKIPIMITDSYINDKAELYHISGRKYQSGDIKNIPNGVYILRSSKGTKKIMIGK